MPRMNSLSDARDGSHRAPRRGTALLLTLIFSGVALLVVLVLLASREKLEFGIGAIVLTAFCSAFVLLCVAALGWHFGVRLTRQQLGESLREARMQAQVQSQLQADWQWATDAEHHIVRWQAPQGAPASSWVGMAATQVLWDRFELSDEVTLNLRAKLEARANFSDTLVRARDGAAGVWRLRGIACFDGQGRFAGYQGTAHKLAAVSPVANEPQWTWLEALPVAAWVLGEGEAPVAGNRVGLALGPRPGKERLSLQPFTEAGRSYVLATLLPEPAAAPAGGDVNEHASFSYTVSHDLRAPLRVVEGFARILKEDYGRLLDRVGNDHLDRVMGAAARMNSMIDSLLSLANLSMQPLAHQPVNLSQVAGFVVEELRRAAPERAVEVHIQPQLSVQGDPTLLRMMLENLLGNAWKYSAKCAQTQISFEATEQDGTWIYCVRDNGAGFDMRFADRLFSAFQRLHSASDFQGTGVGLASVRRIVRRHGGEIWAEAEVGQGARFYFTLASSSTASTRRAA